MRDADVRLALHAKVLRDHHADPDTLVLNEFAVWYGTARVDIAVVNGRIEGYEIKSDRDTLERLPQQQRIYATVFDRLTLVVGQKLFEKASASVPEWWGIKLARPGPRGAVHFEMVRAPRINPSIDPVAVAALLWNAELTSILERHGALRGYRGVSRDKLCRRAVEVLPLTDLRAEVRACLKARTDWRSDAPRT